jgi:hypothetical protein
VVSSIYGARRLKGTELFSFFFLFNTQLIHVGHQRAAAAAGSGIHFAFVAVIPALFFLRIVPFLLKIPPQSIQSRHLTEKGGRERMKKFLHNERAHGKEDLC